MKHLFASALLAGTLLISSTTPFAQDTAQDSQQMSMDELASRLNLTAEQQEKIKPFAEERRARLSEIHGKMSSATSRRDKMAVMKEARQVQDDFVSQVEPLLTSEQQARWKQMRAEARDQMKERFRNRRSAQ